MRCSSGLSALLVSVALASGGAHAAEQPLVGETAPGFELTSLDGATVALEDYRGQLVVLHFGAGW